MRYSDDLPRQYVNGQYTGESVGSRLPDGLALDADGLSHLRSVEHIGAVLLDGADFGFPAKADVARWQATGQEGPNEGVVYVEYELRNVDDERISLATGDIEYIGRNGQQLTPDDQETLWFRKSSADGRYNFEIKLADGNTFVAPLDWRK